MEEYTYYIDSENGLIPYDYYELVHSVYNGTIGLSQEVIAYDPITHYKKKSQAKYFL